MKVLCEANLICHPTHEMPEVTYCSLLFKPHAQ